MGCYPSSCRPGRRSSDALGGASMTGLVFGELGKWKTSIEILEGRKKPGTGEDDKSNLKAVASGELTQHTPAERVGLSQSYKQLKEKLFRSSDSGSINGENQNPNMYAKQQGKSAAEWKQKRANALESLSSGELMLSMDPSVMQAKLLSPPNERERQETVDALKIVEGSQNEPHFDNIVDLAAKIFKVPFAHIAVIDRRRIWIKAAHGAQAQGTEFSRESSLVSYMLLNERKEVMVVEDTAEDGRFHDIVSKTRAKKRTRFFAAAPLYASNGFQVGALTISDLKPRKLDAGSFSLLTNLAETVVRALEKEAFGQSSDSSCNLPAPLDAGPAIAPTEIQAADSNLNLQLISDLAERKLQQIPSLRKSPEKLLRSMNMLETGIMVCDATSKGMAGVLYVSDIWTQMTGIPAKDANSQSLWHLFSIPGQEETKVQEELKDAFAQQRTVLLTAKLRSGGAGTYELSFKTASADSLDTDMPLVGVPSFVEFSRQLTPCYFFVTVRKTKDIDSHRLPTSAFEEAAGAEPWSPVSERGTAADPEAPPTPENGESPMQRKPSVTLPYNDDVFSSVTLGPLFGRGSFGKVHRGLWNNRQIAVKILEVFQQGSLGEEVDDLPEATLMEEMQHPNVMQTYKHATRAKHPSASGASHLHFGELNENSGYMLETWLLLEACNKGSLQDAIDRGWFRTEPSRAKGKPDMSIILPTALELARGLEYLHSKGVLHGDLSPGNVLLQDCNDAPHGFTVKIADFGLSRAAASHTIRTQTFGTVTHMPPELLMEGKLTRAADVYAFGVLLWGMYTGVPPWQGMRRTQVLFKVTALGATLQIPSNCPPFMQDLLTRCMQRDHKERPDFTAIASELEGLIAAESRAEEVQPVGSQSPRSPLRKMRSLSLSMPRSKLPEVAEAEPMEDDDIVRTPPMKVFRKAPSLQRRPSFSQQTQLEVI